MNVLFVLVYSAGRYSVNNIVEKRYGGVKNIDNCRGNQYYTGVTEKESFFTELGNLVFIMKNKNKISKQCRNQFPNLLYADVHGMTIMQSNLGVTLDSVEGYTLVNNMTYSDVKYQLKCIHDGLKEIKLVHCDLKPSNFVINVDKKISIIDFDIAHKEEETVKYPHNGSCEFDIEKLLKSTKWKKIFDSHT